MAQDLLEDQPNDRSITDRPLNDRPPNDRRDAQPVSDRQAEANQRNAQQSTGPKSEDVEAFDALLANMKAELKPEGQAEEGMVRRAADIWWRLGRTAAIEAGFLSPAWSVDPRAEWTYTGGGMLVDGFRVALDQTKTLDQLGRYEARLERALKRTFDLLYQMQAHRRRITPDAPAEAPVKKQGH